METVDHFLLNCKLYDEERYKLRRKVGSYGIMSILLENSQIIKNNMDYIEETEPLIF